MTPSRLNTIQRKITEFESITARNAITPKSLGELLMDIWSDLNDAIGATQSTQSTARSIRPELGSKSGNLMIRNSLTLADDERLVLMKMTRRFWNATRRGKRWTMAWNCPALSFVNTPSEQTSLLTFDYEDGSSKNVLDVIDEHVQDGHNVNDGKRRSYLKPGEGACVQFAIARVKFDTSHKNASHFGTGHNLSRTVPKEIVNMAPFRRLYWNKDGEMLKGIALE